MKLPFTLKQLRILKAIASKKNFTKAAKMLFISQPTLSKQLQLLEYQLGICLINRETTIIGPLKNSLNAPFKTTLSHLKSNSLDYGYAINQTLFSFKENM